MRKKYRKANFRSDMKDIKVGTEFCYGKTKLRVEAADYNNPVCTGCFFSDFYRQKRRLWKFSCHIHKMACTPNTRSDRRNVIFREVI